MRSGRSVLDSADTRLLIGHGREPAANRNCVLGDADDGPPSSPVKKKKKKKAPSFFFRDPIEEELHVIALF